MNSNHRTVSSTSSPADSMEIPQQKSAVRDQGKNLDTVPSSTQSFDRIVESIIWKLAGIFYREYCLLYRKHCLLGYGECAGFSLKPGEARAICSQSAFAIPVTCRLAINGNQESCCGTALWKEKVNVSRRQTIC